METFLRASIRQPAETGTLVTEVSGTGAKAITLQLDSGKIGTFDAFVPSVAATLVEMGAERFGYLINNAGTYHHAPFDKVTEKDLDSLYNVDFKGVFFLTLKLLPLMNYGGRIVMISSGRPDSPFREAPLTPP